MNTPAEKPHEKMPEYLSTGKHILTKEEEHADFVVAPGEDAPIEFFHVEIVRDKPLEHEGGAGAFEEFVRTFPTGEGMKNQRRKRPCARQIRFEQRCWHRLYSYQPERWLALGWTGPILAA